MADEPAFLSKGVEVSAKYRGAFCEAKVKQVEKCVKCKVVLKEDGKSMIVSDDDIRGNLKVGCSVEVHKPDSTRYMEATLIRITDHSLYTVVFDDGDENTLRRSKLCLKGSRHFMKSETLDDLPLTNPEQFSTPVIRKSLATKRSKSNDESGSESDDEDEDSMSEDSLDDENDRILQSQPTGSSRTYAKALQDFVGQVVCIDMEDRGKKMVTLPVLVVVPTADELMLPSANHFLVKSFKDNKFMSAALDDAKVFSAAAAAAKMTTYKDKVYKYAWDKAQQYVDQQELPVSWDRTQLLGNMDVGDSDELSDSEPAADERRDLFVAQLYKFMDDRGTPINRAPTFANSDLDLFHLFRIVASMGGYNRVNNLSRWSTVFMRMKLHTLMPVSGAMKQIKDIYEKYLHAYEDINRKLGCTLVLTSQTDRGRYTHSRSLFSFRERTDRQLDVAAKMLLGRGTPGRQPSSLKDDVAADSKPSVDVKEESNIDADDTDKSDASTNKPDEFTRSTRKTLKRLPAAVVGKPQTAVTETKTSDESTSMHTRLPAEPKDSVESKDSLDSVVADKKEASAKPKVTRQRIMNVGKLPKPGIGKMKLGGGAGGLSKKTTTGDDKTGKKLPGRPGGLKVEEKYTKKKLLIEKKCAPSGQIDVKRTLNLLMEKVDSNKEDKSSVQKRPMRRVLATDGLAKSSGVNISVSSKAEMDSTGADKSDEGKGSRLGSVDEGLAVGSRLRVKYGKGTNFRAYEAKIIDVRNPNTSSVEYRVHYAGWNTRYDEWIKCDSIISVIDTPAADSTTPVAGRQKQASSTASTPAVSVKKKGLGSALTTPVALPGRQKRLASGSDTSKTSLKAQAAKIPCRRTRTRSRTHHAADSDSVSVSSNGSASDVQEAESVGRRPSVSATDSSQQTSVVVGEEHETSKSSDVTPVNSQLQPTVSDDDQTTVAQGKSESDEKPGHEHHEATRSVDIEKQEGTTDTWTAEDVSKSSITMSSSTEQSHEGKKFSPESDISQLVTVAKEACGDVESPVKTRGKSRICSRSVSSSVDAVADLEGSAVESAAESGKVKPSVEDKTKTPRVKKKCTGEDNLGKIEKKAKVDVKKLTEDKAAGDEYSNEEESKITVKLKEEESSQKSKGSDLKEKVDKQELESNDQKGKGKDTNDPKSQKSVGTRKSGLCTTNVSREKRSRLQAEKTDSSEVSERSVGRSRRKAKVVPSDIVLSEAENSQEPEQYSVYESSDSASTKLDTKTVKQETVESSFEGLSAVDEFSSKITDANVTNLSAKEQCYKTDVCENLLETNAGAAAGIEHMLHADVSSLLTAALSDSPAYTSADELGPAGGSSSSSAGGTSSLSPAADADEEHTSTKSELEANMEVAAYMGGGSTNEGELSSDEDDDDSSSVNTSSCKPSVKSSSCATKRKSDDGSFQHSGKRRRREKQHRTRSQHASSAAKTYSYRNDASDSDENDVPSHPTKPSADVSAASNFSSKLHGARIVKYNFLDLKEGQFLEGEERIAFLMSKIQDLRRVYMDLKAEVACIDRRRRRHRTKEREAQQQANTTGSFSLVSTASSS